MVTLPKLPEIDRDALYSEVWSAPMTQLGVKYGVTGPEIKKQCVHLQIPSHRAGYRSRHRHGYPAEKPPLPPLQVVNRPIGKRSKIGRLTRNARLKRTHPNVIIRKLASAGRIRWSRGASFSLTIVKSEQRSRYTKGSMHLRRLDLVVTARSERSTASIARVRSAPDRFTDLFAKCHGR